jgi:hypothetical protein
MTLDKCFCEEGKRLNAQLIKQDDEIILAPGQTKSDYPYKIKEEYEHLQDDPPWEKKVEVMECKAAHATVKVLGNSLRDLVS